MGKRCARSERDDAVERCSGGSSLSHPVFDLSRDFELPYPGFQQPYRGFNHGTRQGCRLAHLRQFSRIFAGAKALYQSCNRHEPGFASCSFFQELALLDRQLIRIESYPLWVGSSQQVTARAKEPILLLHDSHASEFLASLHYESAIRYQC